MVEKLNTKARRFRAIQYSGPVDFGPSKFHIVARKWLGQKCEGPHHPEDGSMILVVNGLARRVAIGDWLVRFNPAVFHVFPDAVARQLFEIPCSPS